MDIERHPSRMSVVDDVAEMITSVQLQHPTRVAVDGRSGAGKTTFADELAAAIAVSGREVIRASIDDFHQPAAFRYRRGRLSPNGYFEDARDLDAMRRLLLDPLGPEGERFYATEAFDLERDRPLQPKLRQAPVDAILILDGTFLQREELRSAWDFVVFLDVSEDEARRRGVERDAGALGSRARVNELYVHRYDPAYRRYEFECTPAQRADVIIDNLHLQSPTLIHSS
jgi:uridine kinase